MDVITPKRRTPFRKSHGRITIVVYNRPSDCGGKCLFCIWEKGLTRSTVTSEDTLMARACNWDPVCQIAQRFKAYGLRPGLGNKYGLAIKGDSFTNHKQEYLLQYFKSIYDFLNGAPSASFDEAKAMQAHAPDRCVQIQVETRPDQIDDSWCQFMLRLGVTTVEIGVQSLDDAVLEINRRGHGVDVVAKATGLLRKYGFEVGYHMMTGMVGSSVELDVEILGNRLWEPAFSPDVLKIYPCVLLKDFRAQRQLAKYADSPAWQPLDSEAYLAVLMRSFPSFPRYVHVNRIQRLISPETIYHGPTKYIDRRTFNGVSQCLWQRGVAQSGRDLDGSFEHYTLTSYRQGDGWCVEAVVDRDVVLGYARISPADDGGMLIRDVRVLGNMVPVGEAPAAGRGTQHHGIGKRMVGLMEQLAARAGSPAIRVHPADGASAYFESLGYVDRCDGYLEKILAS